MNTTEIRKGDRLEHKTGHKIGTAARDQHDTINGGHAVYVWWDNAKTNACNPVNVTKLRKI